MGSSRTSTSRLELFLQRALEPVFWVNGDLKILGVNRAWESLTGYASDAVVGLDCKLTGSDEVDGALQTAACFHVPIEAIEGRSASSDILVRRANGESVWRRVDFEPLRNEQGKVILFLGFVRVQGASGLKSPDSERLRTELLLLRERAALANQSQMIVGKGDWYRRLLGQIEAAASVSSPVLIAGEPGTGKTLVAQTIHLSSHRPQRPLLAIDCEALPPAVIDRTLFGLPDEDESRTKVLRFALPDGATLLLENALSLSRDIQERIASIEDKTIRWIATSSADMEAAFREDRLRGDFYHRLTTFVIRLQPLLERLEELPLLAQAFLERSNLRLKKAHSSFTEGAIETLLAYDWPGNLQELSRVIDFAVERALENRIGRGDLPPEIQGNFASSYLPSNSLQPPITATLDELLEQVERRILENALNRFGRNKSRAAESLGISRPRLHRRIKELKLSDFADGVE